jgi:hypothetical protein
MKTCFKCGFSKPLSEYYKHSMMADGHLNKCKECTKTDVKKHRKENDTVRDYDRKRGNRQNLEYLREYREKYPKKYKAHSLVNSRCRSGKLVNPGVCEECPSDFAVEAHHDDCDLPLVVRWLCSRCHKIWHAAHGEALNAV